MSDDNIILRGGEDTFHSFIFRLSPNETIMEIHKDGRFIYKGETIEDTHEIYECVVEFFSKANNQAIENKMLCNRIAELEARIEDALLVLPELPKTAIQLLKGSEDGN